MYVFGSGRCRRCGGGARGLRLGNTNAVVIGRVWDVCMCYGCGGVGGGVGEWLGPGSGIVEWYYVYVCCESGFFVEMVGPGICVL